jgi:hypothetical protein
MKAWIMNWVKKWMKRKNRREMHTAAAEYFFEMLWKRHTAL